MIGPLDQTLYQGWWVWPGRKRRKQHYLTEGGYDRYTGRQYTLCGRTIPETGMHAVQPDDSHGRCKLCLGLMSYYESED